MVNKKGVDQSNINTKSTNDRDLVIYAYKLASFSYSNDWLVK